MTVVAAAVTATALIPEREDDRDPDRDGRRPGGGFGTAIELVVPWRATVRPAPTAATSSSLLSLLTSPPSRGVVVVVVRRPRGSKSAPSPAAVSSLRFRESRRPSSSGSAVPFVSLALPLSAVSFSRTRTRKLPSRRTGPIDVPLPLSHSLTLLSLSSFSLALWRPVMCGFSPSEDYVKGSSRLALFLPTFLPYVSSLRSPPLPSSLLLNPSATMVHCTEAPFVSRLSRIYVTRRVYVFFFTRNDTHEDTLRQPLSLAATSTIRETIVTIAHHELDAPLAGRLREPRVALLSLSLPLPPSRSRR